MKCSLVFGLFLLLFAAPFALADPAGSISVCKGENAVFEFELYNQAEPLTYSISPSGITGTLSTTTLSLGRGEAANFSFLVATVNRNAGSYPFTIIADGGVSVSRASGLLVVSDCYGSMLTLNATSATVERCGSVKVKVSVQNTGSKQDAFALSSSGDLPVAFSPTALSVGPSSQASADAVVSVPCATSTGTHTLQINSSGHSKQFAKLTVYVTAPTPTPTPKGCAYSNPACASPKVCQNNACVLPSGCNYSNPACASPKVCQNNACVLPSGCKYNNPACASGFSCNSTTNLCVEIPPVPVPVITTTVRACKGETARFKFSIYNPEAAAAAFNVTANSQVNGTLSAAAFTVPGKSSESVYYTVNTTRVAVGTYPITLVASNGKTSGFVASQLQVEDCFASNLTLVSAISKNQTIPVAFPSTVPVALPTAVATTAPANASAVPSLAPTAVANASNATNVTKPASVLWAIVPNGMVFESGLQKAVTVTVRNSADYDVRSVRILISNMTVSDVTLPLIPAGKSVNVDLVVSTGLSKPFNATIRAVGEQGSGETVFLVNATEGKVAAKTFKSAATTVNGTNGSVERVNATVRLYNYANATANVTVSVRDSAVNVTPAAVSIPANSYVEVSLSAQLPKGKGYNATLVVTSKAGATYALPVSLRVEPASASTGLFSGGLVSMFSLAVVAIGVILVLFYFARKNSDEDEGDESGDEDGEDAEDENPKEEKKQAKKKR